MSYVTFYAIVTTSGPMVEHINGRRLGVIGTLWNFTFGGKVPELYGTL